MGPIQGRAPADTAARAMIRMHSSTDHPKWLKAERVDDISRRYFMAVISGVNEVYGFKTYETPGPFF
jgi:hypothetical protein